jgi:hypothetical protein
MSWLNRKRPEEAQGNHAVAEPQRIELSIRCSPEEAADAQVALQKLLGHIGLEEIRRLEKLMGNPSLRGQALKSLYSHT